MVKAVLWILIGLISGLVLAIFLKIPQLLWQVDAYNLLFEVSYIPLLNQMRPVWLIQGIFHFATCIFSLCILYYLLAYFKKEMQLVYYIVIVGIGSTLLYFLTLLPDNTPPITDYVAWSFWTIGHVLFSLTGWYLIREWIGKKVVDRMNMDKSILKSNNTQNT